MKRFLTVLLCLVLTALPALSAAEQSYAPVEFDMSALPVTEYDKPYTPLEKDGQRIYGVAYIPEGDGPFPTVICTHGLGVNSDTCLDYAEAFASHGVAAYVFDFRGGSVGSRSEGKLSDMTIMTEVSDLEAVLEQVRAFDFVDSSRVALMGYSQGGIVSAIVAARHPEEVAALMLCYPAFNLPELIRTYFRSADAFPDSFDFGWVRVGHQYGVDIYDYDPYQEIGLYEKPVLLLQGSEDTMVPPVYTYRAHKIYPHSSLYIIDGAGHGFTGDQFDQAMNCAYAYLTEIGFLSE